MTSRFKKEPKVENMCLKKEEFLEEHNKLSPENLKATIPLLSRFKDEKPSLFKNEYWPMDKIRRPFISWLISLSLDKKN